MKTVWNDRKARFRMHEHMACLSISNRGIEYLEFCVLAVLGLVISNGLLVEKRRSWYQYI